MGHIPLRDRDLFIDLECGVIASEEGTGQSPVLGYRQAKYLSTSVANGSVGVECHANSYSNMGETSEVVHGNIEVLIGNDSGDEDNGEHVVLVEKKHVSEKHKKANYKKAPKPPRPPKGPSLDDADLKLVKEISALAMEKRARSERLKTLRKRKEAKLSSVSAASSLSLSSPGSLFAMLITVLFFLVILCQVETAYFYALQTMHPGFGSEGRSGVSLQGSPEPPVTTKSLISVQFYYQPSADDGSRPSSESPSHVEQASGPKFRCPG
ncbi:Serine-rich coiled-coil domain-containing protein [Actinidia chinensis var. chinensis]|uniref:Serine-rich coiled-coil domain-containing protein n=1 Tax=Actinidia chinensis var. chinensis TaxID=1590841 RepID=A0A2R6PNR0_ACTCC|nr:Serine-rich coiled-coil domain-containing protein [Actinidia chinensis var. chinensis]